MKSILANFDVTNLFLPTDEKVNWHKEKLRRKRVNIETINISNGILLANDIKVEFFRNQGNGKNTSIIEGAVVTKIHRNDFSFLVCPNINESMMQGLLSRKEESFIKNNVVITTYQKVFAGEIGKEFLMRVNPKYIVVCGKRKNSFSTVFDDAEAGKWQVLRSEELGCISFLLHVNNGKWQVKQKNYKK